jgi:LemA protein
LATANDQCNSLVNSLLSESSASLKSDSSFLKLQDELIKLEKAITISRQIYNDSVMMYNRIAVVFPNSIFAALFRFKKAQFFEASEAQEFKVSVDIICQYCGTRNPATATRCSGCGSGLG